MIAAAAFALRSQGWDAVAAGGHVVLPIGDAAYHARRALWTAQHWPSLLLFDPLVAFPDGSWIPWPPLHTWLVAGLARALGGGPAAVESVALWLPPLLGALATLPAFAAAARLGGCTTGLGAAALFAALPAQVQSSGAGDIDHHGTVALLGATWLAAALSAASPGALNVLPPLGVALARTGMLLTGSGSLVYLAVADGAQLAALALAGRCRALAAHALGLAASAAVVAAAVPRLGPPVGGPWSAIALSWLHVAALVALALAAAALAAWERARPAASERTRAVRLAAALLAPAALAALPGPREALLSALAFIGQRESWAALEAAQRPLLRGGEGGWLASLAHDGGLAYAIPLLPLAALACARDRRVREPARVLALWTAGFGALALAQPRFGNELAAPAAVAAALGVCEAWRALAGRSRAALTRTALAALVALAALPLVALPIARARLPAPLAAGDGDPRLATPAGTLDRFAETVRAVTPETTGFDDPETPPAYGVLAPPELGHALRWGARRALAADDFGAYAGSRPFEEARAFSWLESEAEAVALAERLRARFVVTVESGAMPPRSLAVRLHRDDGRARAAEPRWERFRLIAEGPAGGRPLADRAGTPAPAGAIPYKLFEVVRGALIEAQAEPGTPVTARMLLETPDGRRISYRAVTLAADDGIARLRVPYPGPSTLKSDGAVTVRALGPWRVRIGGVLHEATVGEDDVRRGATVAVGGGGA